MEGFETLQKIGASEISKKTHIALNKIQNILERNYQDLRDRATTYGLLQILEREYHISLREWQQEYEVFWKDHESTNKDEESLVNFKVTLETTLPNSSKKSLILGIVLLVALGGGLLTFVSRYENPVGLAVNDNIQSIEPQDEIKEPHLDLDALESANPTSNPVPKEEQEEVVKGVSITPKLDVWIGIVYLDNKRRSSMTIKEPFKVDLTRPQTIVTGHGMLDLNIEGEESAFNSANKMFFIVEDGGFRQVTRGEYEDATGELKW